MPTILRDLPGVNGYGGTVLKKVDDVINYVGYFPADGAARSVKPIASSRVLLWSFMPFAVQAVMMIIEKSTPSLSRLGGFFVRFLTRRGCAGSSDCVVAPIGCATW